MACPLFYRFSREEMTALKHCEEGIERAADRYQRLAAPIRLFGRARAATMSEDQPTTELLEQPMEFLGQIGRACPTLSRRLPWQCVCTPMVTSGFSKFEAP